MVVAPALTNQAISPKPLRFVAIGQGHNYKTKCSLYVEQPYLDKRNESSWPNYTLEHESSRMYSTLCANAGACHDNHQVVCRILVKNVRETLAELATNVLSKHRVECKMSALLTSAFHGQKSYR